jgi:phosphohistidine phosphatase
MRQAGESARMSPPRRLYVLRHAKSSWEDPALNDHQRPLAPRGRRAVKLLAAHLAAEAIRPELVLCSDARRTIETLEGVLPGVEASIEPELYGATHDELVQRLRRVQDGVRSVMLVGHNPAVQMLVVRLAGDHDARSLDDIRRKFPTGALATLELACDWGDLTAGCARLAGYVRPKSLQYQ